ncbi:hypothetical protein E4K10_44370 [Streptomyces sp. T1317-0309]|nr:hypothetical protein E4K10_44370 [Streptomyces sp. T1317-0309]
MENRLPDGTRRWESIVAAKSATSAMLRQAVKSALSDEHQSAVTRQSSPPLWASSTHALSPPRRIHGLSIVMPSPSDVLEP